MNQVVGLIAFVLAVVALWNGQVLLAVGCIVGALVFAYLLGVSRR
jgi:hypothetical protein